MKVNGKCLSCSSSQDAEPISVDFETPLFSAQGLHHVGVHHHLPAVAVEVDLGVDGGEVGEGAPVGPLVNGTVVHPWVPAPDIDMEAAW